MLQPARSVCKISEVLLEEDLFKFKPTHPLKWLLFKVALLRSMQVDTARVLDVSHNTTVPFASFRNPYLPISYSI